MIQRILEFLDRKTADYYDVYVYLKGRWEHRHTTMATSKRMAFNRMKELYEEYGMGWIPIAVVRKNRQV